MKILVTGSAGFIGFNLCKHLLSKNKHFIIYGIDNLNDYYSVSLKRQRLAALKKYKNFKFFNIDIKNKMILEKFFKLKKLDIVINFAAQAGVRYSVQNPKAYLESNVLGFFNVLENCRKYKIKKLLFASSSSVYGNSKHFPLKENILTDPINFYGLTKKNNEEMAQIFSKNYDMKIIGLRFFTVFGEWGRPDMVIYKLFNSIFKNKIFQLNNKGNHYRDFTHISDVVNILEKLISLKIKKNYTVLNISANRPVKLTYLLKLLKLQKINLKIKKVSIQAGYIVKTHGDNKNLLKFFKNYKFKPFSEGFYQTLFWYKKNFKRFN